jgi:hypothetical protein
MSTAALNLCNVPHTHPARRLRETRLRCRVRVIRNSPRSTIALRSSCPFCGQRRGPSPRPRKNRSIGPKNSDHIGRNTDTTHCHSTASAIPCLPFAARQEHANMLTSPCHRVRNPGNPSPIATGVARPMISAFHVLSRGNPSHYPDERLSVDISVRFHAVPLRGLHDLRGISSQWPSRRLLRLACTNMFIQTRLARHSQLSPSGRLPTLAILQNATPFLRGVQSYGFSRCSNHH